jgi:hypothetical protein
MILGRLFLRLLLVPLAASIAIFAAVVFVTVAHWTRFAALVAANRGGDGDFDGALVFAAAVVVFLAAISAAKMLWPMVLGALIAEAFAIRSWVFHVCNGGVSAWVGLNTMSEMGGPYDLYNAPVIVIGAGIVAGFAYWLVAGWSAGFWKPVFAQPQPALPQPPIAPVAIAPPPVAAAAAPENEIAGQNPAIRDSTIRLDN